MTQKPRILSRHAALVIAVVVVGSLLGATVAVATHASSDVDRQVEEWLAQQEGQKIDEVARTGVDEDNRTFYEWSYERATPEQREQLDAIIADHSLGVGEWRRNVLITLGYLSADTPRLTAQDAAELYGKVEYKDLENEFNRIAGAPDWVGGSGIHRVVYFLNDERTEAIYLIFGDVHYVIFNEDGTQTRLPIGDQKLLPYPGPSVGPDSYNTVFPEPSPTAAPCVDDWAPLSEPD
jgi:hypothetical protein